MYTRNLQKLTKKDVDIAGGKGASLGEMIQAGINIPGGFVVLTNAFDRFFELTDINIEIDAILATVDKDKMHTFENASKQIEALILGAEIPKEIEREIQGEFKKLDVDFVAVRSSATSEDGLTAAWAGQLDSFLNTNKKNLLLNLRKCWASLFSPRAIFYRFEKELQQKTISVAVVIQKMVDSEKSGIAFSVHPVTEDYNQLIIEAGWGLGDAIVSGQITPDSYVVTKDDFEIIDKNILTQQRGLFRDKNGGNQWQNIKKSQGEKQVLSDEEILQLSKEVKRIEKLYGLPQDIEWAMEGGEFYITQSRPITTLQ